jgi:quercetin dioxygenase-like cupin family protein
MKLPLANAGLAVLCLTGAAHAADAPKATVWPAADIKWMDMAALKGAQIAVLWGDPKTGAYGALKKLPAGSQLALHTHSQDQKVVMVAGTIALSIDGAAAKDLAPGSYTFIPANVPHVSDCKAGTDCIYFEEQPGASDFKPVEKAPAKK